MTESFPSTPDSLFDEISKSPSEVSEVSPRDPIASRQTPSIKGLYVFPDLLPWNDANKSLQALAGDDVFIGGSRDQVMLFSSSSHADLPNHTLSLLETLELLVKDRLPMDVQDTVFHQPAARQVIYNLYPPGQGIASHVDLPRRYGDGILGVSLTGGCVMTFVNASEGITGQGGEEKRFDVYLPSRTVYVLTQEARWDWAHGIEGRYEDVVKVFEGDGAETLLRDLRVSVTFRWMKEGADILT